MLTILTVSYAPTSIAFDYLQPLPEKPLVGNNNPMSEEKVLLGKWLFYQNDLSKNKSISCNNCHNLLIGGNDGEAFSTGQSGKKTRRSTPNLWNIGLQTVLYWDGRSKSLEQQTEEHLKDANIMAMSSALLINRLAKHPNFLLLFKAAFPTDTINIGTISKALASFERSLMAFDSPFDRYIKGDKTALSALAIRGITAFNESGCLACHFGVNFAGPAPGPAMGLGDGFYELFPTVRGTEYEVKYDLISDKGLFEFSGLKDESYMWRVPSLRNIELSPPYFHNGSAKTLGEAIKVMGKVQFNKDLTDNTVKQIAAFLRSLTGQRPAILQ